MSANPFSPDGSTMLSLREKGHEAELIDTRTGKRVWGPIKADDPFYNRLVLPGGRLIVTGHEDGMIRQWDSSVSVEELASLRAVNNPVDWELHMSVSLDGRRLAALGDNGCVTAEIGNLSRSSHVPDVWPSNRMLEAIAMGQSTDPAYYCYGSHVEAYGLDDEMPLGGFELRGRSLVIQPSADMLMLSGTDSSVGFMEAIQPWASQQLYSLECIEGPPDVIKIWCELVCLATLDAGAQLLPLSEEEWDVLRSQLIEKIGGERVSPSIRQVADDPLYWIRCSADAAQADGRWDAAIGYLNRLCESEPENEKHRLRLAELQTREARSP
jgi:hypothetical protein